MQMWNDNHLMCQVNDVETLRYICLHQPRSPDGGWIQRMWQTRHDGGEGEEELKGNMETNPTSPWQTAQ